MAVIGAVTDDFTGTASAGVLVARSQAKTGLFFDADAVKNFKDSERLDAVYVSSNSRHMPPREAYRAVKEVTEELKQMGIRYYSKKIDTTLRGGIGYEIDAMLDCLGPDTTAVMVTAMPQSRRVCVGGFSIIDGVILTETPVAKDVKTPVRECYVPELIRGQSKNQVDFICLRDVLSGVDPLKKKLAASKEQKNRIIIVDAITMDHLDIIAKACVQLGWNILAVDPGAFTMKLAYHRGVIGEEKPALSDGAEPDGTKTALFIVGSANPATEKQIDVLCAHGSEYKKVSVSPLALLEGGSDAEKETGRAVCEVTGLLEQQNRTRAVIVETALHGTVVNLEEEDRKRGYRPGTSSALINRGLAEITKRVLEYAGKERIAGLLLTGGDTMESVCRTIGVECIQALDNIVAQVDVGRIMGAYEGLPIVVKGGFCGYEDIGIDIVERLLLEASK